MIERLKFSTSTYCTRSYIVRTTVLLSAPTPVQYVPHPNISLFSDENVVLRNINREGNVQYWVFPKSGPTSRPFYLLKFSQNVSYSLQTKRPKSA